MITPDYKSENPWGFGVQFRWPLEGRTLSQRAMIWNLKHTECGVLLWAATSAFRL